MVCKPPSGLPLKDQQADTPSLDAEVAAKVCTCVCVCVCCVVLRWVAPPAQSLHTRTRWQLCSDTFLETVVSEVLEKDAPRQKLGMRVLAHIW